MVDIFMKYKTSKYLKEIKITDEEYFMGPISSYSLDEKSILLFIKNILSNVNGRFGNLDTNNSKLLFYIVFQSLLHEIQHSSQYCTIDSLFTKSLEKDLLCASMVPIDKLLYKHAKGQLKCNGSNINKQTIKEQSEIIINIWKSVYFECYDYMLLERLAEFESFNTLRKIFKYKNGYEDLHYLSIVGIRSTLIKGYRLFSNISLSPTVVIMQKLQDNNFYSKIPFDWYSEDQRKCLDNVSSLYDFKTRCKYGLPISKNEYVKMKKAVQKSTDKLNEVYGIYIKR